ncbi:hypothetical protein J6590_018857 [Homalodisca vitripennis]|nr:hypothetical protein J6590_018857 [Homalodisca vitripennis]
MPRIPTSVVPSAQVLLLLCAQDTVAPTLALTSGRVHNEGSDKHDNIPGVMPVTAADSRRCTKKKVNWS